MNKRYYLIPALLVCLLASCTKNTTTELSETGAISGHVTLYDQYGSRDYLGLSNVQLQLNGGAATMPDSTGYYAFKSVTTGEYNITANAHGYASTRVNNFQFIGDTVNRDIRLSAIPNFAPASVTSYTAAGNAGDSIVLNFTADTRVRNCIIFIGKSSTVNNTPASYLLEYTKAIAANQTKVAILIPAADLYNAGISSGSTAYGAAYGYVVSDQSVYEDLATGRNVYNAVSNGNVPVTIMVP